MNKQETKTLLDALVGFTTDAEAVKASGKGAAERKVARAATNLSEMLEGLVEDEELTEMLGRLAEEMSSVATDTFDTTEGQQYADAIAALVATPIIRPEGFDVEAAETLLARWKAATGRKARGTRGEDSPDQSTPCPIRVTFTYPEGSEVGMGEVITHNYWPSVSAEISKRAEILDGMKRGEGYKRPESAKAMWQEVANAIKEGTGDGGTVIVPTKQGDLIAEVAAVR